MPESFEAQPVREEVLRKFLHEVMRIERRYGFELRSAQTERRSRIMTLIDRFSDEELENNETD